MVFTTTPTITALLIFFTAFIVSCIAMPNIIKIAIKRLLFDSRTEERKIHTKDISNLGGMGIFIGFFFSILLFQIVCDSVELSSLSAAAVLLFFVALKDDLTPSSPLSRLFYQFLIASIIVFIGQVHFINIPLFEADTVWRIAVNSAFSLIFIVGMINAMNFIDGIDGLASTIAVFMCVLFGYLFLRSNEFYYAYTAFALAGATFGFLIFNFSPARIFMGDIGSMLIGVFTAIFGIKLANVDTLSVQTLLPIQYPGVLMLSILIVPIMDMITVVLIRLYMHKSPFSADKRHLHHRLLALGFSHPAICFTILAFNILVCGLAFIVQWTNAWWATLTICFMAAAFELIVLWVYMRRNGGVSK